MTRSRDTASIIPTVDAKGDLLVGTADNTVDNLSPGTNGQVLTANSATATGLEWTTPASTGNAIINGAFEINQRNFTSVGSSNYHFDRWRADFSGGSVTVSPQSFTPGAAPLSGYETASFLRTVISGQSDSSHLAAHQQRIESVRSFAGQVVTISFFAKAGSGSPKIGLALSQNFGSGGSPSTELNNPVSAVSISSIWERYSVNYLVPSIDGKTIGTTTDGYLGLEFWLSAGSDLDFRTSSVGVQNNTFEIWGVQLEAGTVATPFRRNAPSIQAELAACQRYYEKSTPLNMAVNTDNSGFPVVIRNVPSIAGQYQSDGWGGASFTFKVPKRVAPSMTFYNTDGTAGNGLISASTSGSNTGAGSGISENQFIKQGNLAGLAAGSAYVLRVQWEARAEL
jgi:hypothetical protein